MLFFSHKFNPLNFFKFILECRFFHLKVSSWLNLDDFFFLFLLNLLLFWFFNFLFSFILFFIIISGCHTHSRCLFARFFLFLFLNNMLSNIFFIDFNLNFRNFYFFIDFKYNVFFFNF